MNGIHFPESYNLEVHVFNVDFRNLNLKFRNKNLVWVFKVRRDLKICNYVHWYSHRMSVHHFVLIHGEGVGCSSPLPFQDQLIPPYHPSLTNLLSPMQVYI